MASVSPMKLCSDEYYQTFLMISLHGSDNGSVPSGNKPLPEPMLTQNYITIRCHQATMGQSTPSHYLYVTPPGLCHIRITDICTLFERASSRPVELSTLKH